MWCCVSFQCTYSFIGSRAGEEESPVWHGREKWCHPWHLSSILWSVPAERFSLDSRPFFSPRDTLAMSGWQCKFGVISVYGEVETPWLCWLWMGNWVKKNSPGVWGSKDEIRRTTKYRRKKGHRRSIALSHEERHENFSRDGWVKFKTRSKRITDISSTALYWEVV